MSFGILMLMLSCFSLYIYLFHVKDKLDLPAAYENSDAATAVVNASHSIAFADKTRATQLHNASLGTLVQVKDIGLELLKVDAKISCQSLFKVGVKRWYETQIDSGASSYYIVQGSFSSSDMTIYTKNLTLHQLGLKREQLGTVSLEESFEFTFEEATYQLELMVTAHYCYESNELEPELCQCKLFKDTNGLQRIQMIQMQSGELRISYGFGMQKQQLNLMSSI